MEYDPDEWQDWEAIGQPMPGRMTYEEWAAQQGIEPVTEPPKVLNDTAENGKIKAEIIKGGDSIVKSIARIDIEKYRNIADNILTDEVVITPERVQHIQERRGVDFLEKYEQYFSSVLSNPDYIFPDDRPNTAIVCKIIGKGDDAINLILRLVVEGDNPDYKNSILTAIKENKKRFA